MSEPHTEWTADALGHGLQAMSGRDPDAHERSATPLELLFDLVFVVAFGQASNEFAHMVAEGQWAIGLFGFGFAMFAIVWGWIQFTWFASAYDTDDWAYRLATMTVMVGALVLALGLPQMFHSLAEGGTVDNGVMVAGYIVMRLAMVALWARAARQDPGRADAARIYLWSIVISQVGWTVGALFDLSMGAFVLAAAVPLLVELTGPYLAETRTAGTPWHADHIAERHGLLVIIALGEAILGTVAAVTALIGANGWSVQAATIAVAGIGLTFGMWWTYFAIPCGALLGRRRDRSFGWGYGHLPLYAAIAGVGAGLHVAALYAEHHLASESGGDHEVIGQLGAVVAIAAPLAVYVVLLYAGYAYLVGEFDPFHSLPLMASVALLAVALLLAAAGAPLVICLLVLVLVPAVTVVAYETRGRFHQAAMLDRLSR